jgi:SET domain
VAHRVVLEALGVFGRIEELEKFVSESSTEKTIFDFDLSEATSEEKEKILLQSIGSLQRNSVPEEMNSMLSRHIDLMKSITKNKKQQDFLGDFMRKQFEIIITNSFGLTSYQNGDVGSGIFALSSYFNHSCAPNITRVTIDNKLAFVVARPVSKNQQLFVCYRGSFATTSKAERREEILRSYRFECVCEACLKNYPLIDDLPSSDTNFIVPPTMITSIESAKSELKTNFDYINDRAKSYPNFEICTLMERNRLLLEAIAQVTPF